MPMASAVITSPRLIGEVVALAPLPSVLSQSTMVLV